MNPDVATLSRNGSLSLSPCCFSFSARTITAALGIIVIIGSLVAVASLYSAMGKTSLYCLSGLAPGAVLLIVSRFLANKTSRLEAKTTRSETEEPLNLNTANEELRKIIQGTPYSYPPQSAVVKAIATPVHLIFEGVFLGNLQAFLSVDPVYLINFSVIGSKVECAQIGAYFSDSEYAQVKMGCSEKNIKLVISATQIEPNREEWSHFKPRLLELSIDRLLIPADDDKDAWKNIEPHLEAVFARIDDARSIRQNVLIHCSQGVSRSPSVLAAYLVSRCNVTPNQALNFVRSKRANVDPTDTLKEGLEQYYRELHPEVS